MFTIIVNNPGPQGPVGPSGSQGPSGSVNTSSLATTGSNTFIGNQIITGSVNITGSLTVNDINVGQNSINFIDNSNAILTTLSVDNNGNLSLSTGSIILPSSSSLTGSLYGTASWAESASQALTASYALNASNIDTGSLLITASANLNELTFTKGNGDQFTLTVNTGSEVDISGLVTTASFDIYTGSISASISSLNDFSSSIYIWTSSTNIFISNLNSFSSSINNWTGSNASQFAGTSSYVSLIQGPGIIINGLSITASARSVNGVFPDTDGNISSTLTQTITGTSASLVLSSSGAVTASLIDGLVWVISNDPTPDNNGDSFIWSSGSQQWYPIAPLDQAASDARYLKRTPQAPLSGNLDLGGYNIDNVGVMFGTSSWAYTASQAISASYAPIPPSTIGGSNTQIQFNSASLFGASSNLTFNSTSRIFNVIGTASFSGSSPNSINITGSWTSTASTQKHISISPTLTSRNTVSDVLIGAQIAPVLSASANAQVLVGLDIAPSYFKFTTGTNIAKRIALRVDGLTVGSGGNGSNTVFGANAGNNIDTAFENTFIGGNAGALVQTGFYNTAVGASAGSVLGTGTQGNTLMGWRSGNSIQNGVRNTAIGADCLSFVLATSDNVAIGSTAGKNTAAGTNATSLSQTVIIGAGAGALTISDSNTIIIGASAGGQGSNTVVLGNNSITRTLLKGNIGIGFTPGVSETAQISASIHITGSISASLLRIDSPTKNNILFVTGSGRIGINTNTPLYTLDISGSTRINNGLEITGSLQTTGSLIVTGSANISSLLVLAPQDPLPASPPTGALAVSSSIPPKIYFYDGTTWNALY